MMKKLAVLILALLLLACFNAARAQTFGSGVPITGVTNVPLISAGAPVTNINYIVLPGKTIQLSGVGNTNDVFIGSFYLQIPGYTNTSLGLTNLYWLASVTNSFLGGTNNGTWTTNTPTVALPVSMPMYMGANIGTNSVTIYVP